MVWGKMYGSKLLVPIRHGLVVKGFDLIVGTVVIGLVVSRITGLQHEGLEIYPPSKL